MNLRRRLLSLFAALGAGSLAPSALRAQTAMLKATPQDALGPFYPPQWTGEIDADLVTLNGKDYLQGTPLALSGRVLSTSGAPISNAVVEIWQTDATGKYRHPGDDGEGPAKRGFQGFGRSAVDADGRFAFRTVKPVLYSGRPPHVHFKVVAPGYRELVTQMYFAGENTERGGWFGFSRERDRLTVTPVELRNGDRYSLSARFDLVLEKT